MKRRRDLMIHRSNVRWSISMTLCTLATAAGCAATPEQPARVPSDAVHLMTPQDLQALPSEPADHRIDYGPDPSQYGELRVPPGAGPHPTAILVHGGCFKAAYATARDLAPMADALKAMGIASWNIEYRRLGDSGGGWPGTYLDVGRAVDYLRTLAPRFNLNTGRVVIVGHSAGGHLAMWAAARARVPMQSVLYAKDPLRVHGVLDLAGPLDMAANIAGYERLCGDTVVTSLLGGAPTEVPARYADVSAPKLLPLGIPQAIVIGEHEDFVPRRLAEAYAEAAAKAGDPVRLIVIPRAGHFEIASPRASTWPRIAAAILSLLDGRLPR
jgi:acetyl esterase/lipase